MNQYKQHHMSKQELKENKLLTLAVDFRHYVVNNRKKITTGALVVLALLVLFVGKVIYDGSQEKEASVKLNKSLFLLRTAKDTDNINLVQTQLTKIARDYSGTLSGARAAYHLGVIQYSVNGFLKSIQSFRQAAENGPSHIAGAAMMGIGDAYTQLNNPKKAVESYREIIEKQVPGFVQAARVKLIQVAIAMGRFKEAATELEILKKDNMSLFSRDVSRLETLLKLYQKRAGITLN